MAFGKSLAMARVRDKVTGGPTIQEHPNRSPDSLGAAVDIGVHATSSSADVPSGPLFECLA